MLISTPGIGFAITTTPIVLARPGMAPSIASPVVVTLAWTTGRQRTEPINHGLLGTTQHLEVLEIKVS
jgi:hypothetical protein